MPRDDTETKARKPRVYSQAFGFTDPGVTSHFSIGLTILFLCRSFEVVTNCVFQQYYHKIILNFYVSEFISPLAPNNYSVTLITHVSESTETGTEKTKFF